MALAAGGAVAAAQDAAPGEPVLYAKTERPGRIDLYGFELPGSRITLYERIGERRRFLSEQTVPQMGIVEVLGAGRWRCDRRLRRFEADVQRSDGTVHHPRYAVRTPPCVERLSLSAPRRAAPRSLVTIRVRDAWRLGNIRPALCVRPPRGRTACHRVAPAADAPAVRRVRIARRGRWRLSLRLGHAVVRRTLLSGASRAADPRRLPTVLVTGDSTVQNLDTVMAERLRRSARVVPDWRGGSMIGGEDPYWPRAATRLARRHSPRLTILSVGGSEGYPIGSAACCDAAWSAAYAARAQAMMRAFARGGSGHTLWLLLPAMRDPRRERIAEAVNEATRAAAAAEPAAVTLVDLGSVLSPGGTYHRTVRYHGRRRVVRQADGIHLTVAGARIASDLIMAVLRAQPQLLAGR